MSDLSFTVIPAIDLRGGRCVRLEQGDYDRETRYEGTPADVARQWRDAGARIIHLVDLDGARSGASQNLASVEAICAAVDIPCELGGGIRDLDDAKRVLDAGVSRVILGTSLAENPALATTLLSELNPEQIVGGLDARDGYIAVHGWEQEADTTPVQLAQALFGLGLRRFIYTDIATDGMFTGPNVAGCAELCRALPAARIIASGGVGGAGHVRELVALNQANLEGVIVGKALYDGRASYAELQAAVD